MKFIHGLIYATQPQSFKILFEKEYKNRDINYIYNVRFYKNKFFYKKTHYGVKFNIKLKSIRRNKNLDLNNLLINSWVKRGLKLNFLKNYNIFFKNWNYLISKDKSIFKNYTNYDFICDLLRTNKFNYNILNLLIFPLEILEHMFELKLKKLSKKMKRKYKKKYIYTIKYLHKPKRLKHTLNMFYSSSSQYGNKYYHERIFNTFIDILFETKKSPIWERKLNVYRIALRFLKKR